MTQHFRDSNFVQLLAANYTRIKALFPNEGRRKWHLRVLQSFWASNDRNHSPTLASKVPADDFMQDVDPFDHLINGDEPGIVLRTDFTDESAWETFYTKLREAEEEIMKAFPTGADEVEYAHTHDSNAHVQMEDTEDQQDDTASEESSDASASLITVINATVPQVRDLFRDLTNVMALRLLNDVDIRHCPAPPSGTKRIQPPNRLIDQGGWQETYVGRTIWIYDTQSNIDQCARLVSQQGDIYGTATGDSWRARVTHICEIQFNLSYAGMKIDFGGQDRWDYSERKRNLAEVEMVQS
ncbi:hypothetical protein JOM56_002391 [Amanita muscaria]